MSRIVVGPFNRVEGDLEIRLESEGGLVRAAWVNSSLYRGFENILEGREPTDALVIAPRICGICSVSHSIAAASALRDAMGMEAAENGRLASNLVHAAENAADHMTHFYLFFMPDFARKIYAERPWYEAAARRFTAIRGEAAADALPARTRLMHVMGLLAGKWPHSLAFQPGGTTRAVDTGDRVRLLTIIADFRAYLESRFFGDDLERIAALESLAGLRDWAAEAPPESSDFRLFLHIAEDLRLDDLGRSPGRFLSYGAFPAKSGRLFRPGSWRDGPADFDVTAVTEDLARSWMRGSTRHPAEGVTAPDADKPGAYSWCKAPRLDGGVAEVGAIARQIVDGQPLIRDLVAESGSNVRNRVIARLVEMARLIPAMERWAKALRPEEPFCVQGEIPDEARGSGLVEAARGSLGHWLAVRGGRIHRYQIISPTTWNFSPRDADGTPGPLEQALVGAPVRPGDKAPISVQHVVRSFDPCMVCTVH